MLLPALSKARNKARTISCVSNFKQISTATIMYINDNQDQFPDTNANLDTATNKYVGYWQLVLYYGQVPSDILVCPSFEEINGDTASTVNIKKIGIPTAVTDYYTTLYWCMIGSNHLLYRKQNPFIPGKLISLDNPSSYLVNSEVYDAGNKGRGYMDCSQAYGTGGDVGNLDPRHDGAVNIYFADGHVETVKGNPAPNKNVATEDNNIYKSSFFSTTTNRKLWWDKY